MNISDKNKLALLHLSLIPGIGPNSVLKIAKKIFDNFCAKQKSVLQNLDFQLDKIYDYSSADFKNVYGLSESIATTLSKGLADKDILQKELKLIEKYKIDLFTFLDPEYPQNLKQIYSPPVVLYCKGAKFPETDKNISIVGARKAKSYAQDVIDDIVPKLVKNGYTIVSGGALGVDSMSHCAALKAEGKTIVVLGSGLMSPYPEENKPLFRSVVQKGGTLISPFPLLMEPLRGNFPARNRIIAGLSSGCLVVQAAKKSGALITAHFSLEEGRQVFAIPGPIFDEYSIGCHNLIKQGAKLVNNVEDILEEFGQTDCCLIKDSIPEKKEEKVKNCLIDPQDDLILKALEKSITLDELSLKVDMNLQDLQEKLFDLQLDGRVKQNIAGFWRVADRF